MKILFFLSLLLSNALLFAQNEPIEFTASEWGTFTTLSGSDGNRLNGLFVDEEKLPSFVFRKAMNNSWNDWTKVDHKGIPGVGYERIPLLNVNVKMETPVIYFYSDKEFEVDVEVDFPKGSISQWFPRRVDGEEQIEIWSPQRTFPTIDFLNKDFEGYIKWNVKVLSMNSDKQITQNSTPKIWSAPRLPKSNLISTYSWNREYIESFLFYRGIGNFDIPIKGEFDGNEKFTLKYDENLGPIQYYVYEFTEDSAMYFHAHGKILPNTQSVIDIQRTWVNAYGYDAFKDAMQAGLEEHGLTWAEARAMLNTWDHSYFKTPGFKVFWILPRTLTDEILPITIHPTPSELRRVMVGRSEFLTPEFEQELLTKDSLYWEDDRYRYAYEERIEQLRDSKYTFSLPRLKAMPCEDCRIQISPNPSKDQIDIRVFFENRTEQVDLIITDLNGRVWKELNIELLNGFGTIQQNISNLPTGIYLISSEKLGQSEKLVKN